MSMICVRVNDVEFRENTVDAGREYGARGNVFPTPLPIVGEKSLFGKVAAR